MAKHADLAKRGLINSPLWVNREIFPLEVAFWHPFTVHGGGINIVAQSFPASPSTGRTSPISTEIRSLLGHRPSGGHLCHSHFVGTRIEELSLDIDTLLVAVGGGGLIAGIAACFGGKVRVVGVEPEASLTVTMALKAGKPVDAPTGGIAADSLVPRRVGTLVYPIAKRHVDHVVLVPDEAISRAQLALWETPRVVTEPGGAAAFVALISGRYASRPGEHVGVLLSGDNTTAVNFG